MDAQFITPENATSWNTRILSNPDGGNVFQGYELAEQKKLGGWTPRFIEAGPIAITAHEKQVLGLGKLWYLPKGPGVSSMRELDELLPHLKAFAKRNNVFLIKIEPELPEKKEVVADLLKLGLLKTRPIQPNFSTILLDLSPDLEDILTNLNQKGRHAIRRAQRDGVIVKRVPATDENCQIMYNLLAETAAGSFGIRHFSYYKTFWQRYSQADLGQIFFAYVENKVVAGAFAVVFGKKSTYKDGASVKERTVYGASHLLQWEVITWAKEKGSLLHDLCGVPPSNEIKNPEHRWYGIGRFKTNFNKTVTDYIGTYDLVINPRAYGVWTRFGERLILRLYAALHHESFY